MLTLTEAQVMVLTLTEAQVMVLTLTEAQVMVLTLTEAQVMVLTLTEAQVMVLTMLCYVFLQRLRSERSRFERRFRRADGRCQASAAAAGGESLLTGC